MIAILQKRLVNLTPGTVFKLEEHEEEKGLLIFSTDNPENGKKFWLTKDFVFGDFEKGYEPLCWDPDLFIVF